MGSHTAFEMAGAARRSLLLILLSFRFCGIGLLLVAALLAGGFWLFREHLLLLGKR
jgi:hypothetical protein